MRKEEKINLLWRFIVVLTIPFSLLGIFFHVQNNWIVTTKYIYQHKLIPENFFGTMILMISDLHNKGFGKNQRKLIEKVMKEQPDIIVVTGDIVDSRRKGVEQALQLIEQLTDNVTVYFVPGNHEAARKDYPRIKKQLSDRGVVLLEDRILLLEKNGEKIFLAGIRDPLFQGKKRFRQNLYQISEEISCTDNHSFRILLSHRPEWMEEYVKHHFNLVLSGHAHGGQVRLPLVGGLYSPGQGFFPKYSEGIYQKEDTTLVVSRGLGNSLFPFRIFNRPEIVVLELRRE